MPTLWTDVNDVRRRALGSDADFSDEEITDLLEDVEDLAVEAFPDLEARVASGVTKLRTVQRILAGAVIRHLRNPEGVRTVQDSDGPFSGSTTYAGDSPGQLSLNDDDKKSLGPPEARPGRRAFSVRPNYLGR